MARFLTVVALVLSACGGPKTNTPTPPAAGPPAVAKEYSAARWIPSKPTYAIAARSIRDAQRAISDAVESFGMLGNIELADASRELRRLLGVDVLSTEALRTIGIDLDGGFAIFSESLNPTFVVHLKSPDQLRNWLDEQRTNATVTSQLVGDVEIFGSRASKKLQILWAIDAEWLWVHFTIGANEPTTWFTASRKPGPATWTADWEWARGAAAPDRTEPSLIGFVDLRALISKLAPRIGDAIDCVQPLRSIGRAGFAIEGSTKHAAIRVSLDIGESAPALAQAILPAPSGWDATSRHAPFAAQWNLDLKQIKTWLDPCARATRTNLSVIDRYGMRTARVFVHSFDPAAKEGSGAVAVEISTKKFFQSLLDDIPLRSTLESKRQYGPHQGRRLALPLLPTVEYILTDEIAFAAFGDGLLARIVGDGRTANTSGPSKSPLLAVDIKPSGLSAAAWEMILRQLRFDNPARFAERLLSWRDGHLGIRLDGTRLVLEARGTRP